MTLLGQVGRPFRRKKLPAQGLVEKVKTAFGWCEGYTVGYSKQAELSGHGQHLVLIW